MAFLLVYITHPDMACAKKVTAHLLERRLIACANVFPVDSAYWWQGRIEESKEVVSIVKTETGNWDMLVSEVARIHPYKVPCIVRLDARGSEPFEEWVALQTRGS